VADEPRIAVFVDYENLAIGARSLKRGQFRIDLILQRLLEKGRIVYKRAYCDWGNYRSAVREFHTQGIELVDIPQSKASGKNSADIRMVVDALDLSHQKSHVDMFALISGDSDFSPLVAKLKENDKRVLGCGIKSSTSELLINSCDEFIYYDDLLRKSESEKAKKKTTGTRKKSTTRKSDGDSVGAAPEADRDDAGDKVLSIVRSLERDHDTVWGSMVKQATRRVYPGFNEEYYGHSSFAELLEGLRDAGVIECEFDEQRGNYIVRSPRHT
jgi:uncharacterized protein (TIGR00288 family)